MLAARGPTKLMVIVPDRVSAWIRKGEVVDRYFNPGNVFDEVHIVLTNDDRIDSPEERAAMQRMVGRAAFEVHNVPGGKPLFALTLAWRPALLRLWARRAVRIARRVRPDLVRCYSSSINAVAAAEITRRLGIPYVVSLHGNPDIDYYRGRRAHTLLERFVGWASIDMELTGLRNARLILPVYSPIIEYLERHDLRPWEIAYNVVGHDARPKEGYGRRHRRLRAVCVGRQDSMQKDPSPIIDAVLELDDVELLLIGNGDLHDSLRRRAALAGDRIRFVPAMPNDEVLAQLADADVYVYSSDNYELSKTVIEAALTGLPIVVNDQRGAPIEELVGDHVRLVEGSAASYRAALQELADEEARAALGRRARAHALAHWSPGAAEARLADIYRDVAGLG